jgi:hypothetical protein
MCATSFSLNICICARTNSKAYEKQKGLKNNVVNNHKKKIEH